MKIGIQTWGSAGDINPFLGLAGGLAAAGHTVTLAIMGSERRSHAPIAQRMGFALAPQTFIGTDEADLLRMGRRVLACKHPVSQFRAIVEEMFEPGVAVMYDAARALAADNDVLIGHFLVHPAHCAAEKAGKPYLTVALSQESIPTRTFPPSTFPNLGRLANGLLWRVAEKVLNRIALPPINRLRQQEGLELVSTHRTVWESRVANLIALSPVLFPPAPDWGAHQRVCGIFRLPDQARPWSMPPGLARFLAEGPPPVYFTFGSMMGPPNGALEVNETTQLLVRSARAAGCRAIIQSHWDVVTGIQDECSIYRLNEAPHPQVFPRCAAVVHHGGAGTTQTALTCGLPSVVVPHMGDQFGWGGALHRVGVAPPFIPRPRATPVKIGRAVRVVLDSPPMTERARRLGLQLMAEDGVGRAVAILADQGLGHSGVAA